MCFFTRYINTGAGRIECIEMDANQAYAMADTVPTDFNVAYVTSGDIKVEENQAYGTNTVPIEPYVAYGTQQHSQIHDYDYVALSSLS